MRMLLKATFPHDKFNTAVKDGSAGKKMQRILEELKPEAAYFGEFSGHRCAIFIINVSEPSRIPTFAEPFFLQFNADVEFHPVMLAEDLAKADLENLGKKWA